MISRTLIKKQRGRRYLTALATLCLATGTLVIASTAAGFSTTNFGLDRDATTTQDAALAHLGALKGAITSGATSFVVCELKAPPAADSIIQIDAERMRIVSTATGTVSTGGCSFANPADKDALIDARSWTVERGFSGTTAAAHVGTTPRNNVTLVTAGTLHDWDQVYADRNDPECTTSGADACVWKNRPNTGTASSANGFTGPTTFTQTSGDLQTISQWRWTNQSVPDADEINDAFAAKYVNGHQELMFGMDRAAVNGTKDIGFWFFHQEVGPKDDGTFGGAHCYAGQTTDGCTAPLHGDLLILTSFSAGGGTTTVRAFEWVGTGPGSATSSDGVLDEVATFGDCVPSGAGNGCATTANSTVPAPWSHTEKPSGASDNVFYASGFMEGGIDLTAAGLEGCFASFLGVSRSSTTLTAQPKAFVQGHFESCESGLVTTPKDGTGNPLAADTDSDGLDEVTIGTGAAGVDVTDSAELTVTGTAFTGNLSFFICGPIESGTCVTGGVPVAYDGTNPVTANGTYSSVSVHLTEVGRYCWRGFFDSNTTGVDDATDSSIGECFEVLPVTPTLLTTAVEASVGLSPTIFGNLADLNGDGVVNGDDDSNAFYGDTSIINGALDCDAWTSDNDGAAGDGVIGDGSPDPADDCTLIGVDGSPTGLTIEVVAGEFQTADGPLPAVFNAADPDNPDVGDSDFAWSTIFGRVDSDGQNPEAITGNDCHVGIIGGANILGSTCGLSPTPPAAFNGYIDLNGDGKATATDSCSTGCFFGRDVFNGLVKSGAVDFGNSLYDAATLTGTANQEGNNGGDATYPSINANNGLPADSKITFTLVGPGDCTSTPTGTGTNPQDVNVSGDGFYLTGGYAPNVPGDYHWKASYPGDGPNTNASSDVTCPEASETVNVRQIPTSISTTQSWYPQDSATITSSEPSDTLGAGGTVEFRLFGPTDAFDSTPAMTGLQNCQADDGTTAALGLVYSEVSDPLTGGANSETETTDNTTFAVTTNDIYYWLVTYTPAVADSLHTGRISDCAETFNIAFTNDSGPGSVFP